MESTTLYYKNGGSDKIYQVSIEPSGDKYLVNIAFGRRGATLQTGTKTPVAVNYSAARAIYDKAIKAKQAKGYTAGEAGTSYTGTDSTFTGIYCQLLNPIEETEVEQYLANDRFAMQQKFDGKRLLIKVEGQQVTGINRRGLECGFPETIRDAALSIAHEFLVDGEAVGEILHAFDLLEIDGHDIRHLPYRERLEKLLILLTTADQKAIQWVVPHMGTLIKRRMFHDLKHEGAEGVVFKDLTAPFTSGCPGSRGSQYKMKFWDTASCIVAKINGRRSVGLELLDEVNMIPVGNVTIPANHEIPVVGAIVEVRYLYAFRGGAMFQPVYLGERDDLAIAECSVDQLKFKSEHQKAA